MFRIICAMTTVPLLTFVAGCRTPDPTVELLESELRWMEDNLYELDYRLDQCHAQLKSARHFNARLREELAEARRAPPGGTDAQREELGYDLESEEDLYDFEPPVVELGDPDEDEDVLPDAEGTLEDLPQKPDPDLELQLPEPGPVPLEDSVDAELGPGRVATIVLNRHLTGGYDFDGHPGHEGVMVVVEPHNAAGQYVPTPGPLEIELSDPGGRGIGAQVGKWQFDAVETAAYFKKTLFGRGAHFTLPWPGPPPHQPELRLTVVYDTVDGRQLRAEKLIRLDPAVLPETHAPEVSARTASWSAEPARDVDPVDAVVAPEWSPTRRQ